MLLSSPISDHQTHPKPSILPYVIQISSRTPSTPIPTHSYPSEALHAHQSLHYQYQAPFTHLKSFKPSQTLHTHPNLFAPISGPPHPPKALHTNLRPFTLISGPPCPVPTQRPSHPTLALHVLTWHPCTLPWPFTPTLGPTCQS